MKIDFEKYADELAPAVVQDAATGRVLMLGFMNREAFRKMIETRHVTFFSRSRRKLWTKGETSGNFLDVAEILTDCDADTILVRAHPRGPVCHTGADTCFGENNAPAGRENIIFELDRVIRERRARPVADSYTSKLFAKGLNKIAQKVGEEAVELIIEAKDRDDELFKGEAADLIYHLLVLFAARDIALEDVLATLERRRR